MNVINSCAYNHSAADIVVNVKMLLIMVVQPRSLLTTWWEMRERDEEELKTLWASGGLLFLSRLHCYGRNP